jgi:serine/threonine protein kinase
MNEGDPGRRVIDGRFQLEARLGGGGMGTVWRARDLVLDRAVALKEVRPPDPALAEYDPEAAALLRARVLREARALARVQHPNVVTIHHVVDGRGDAYPWLVMELVTGGSLADRLARGPVEPHEAARLGHELIGALRAAHAAGIQHRDVKPANVLLRPDGRPVLTDFGIAAIRESTALTATGSVIGTPDYMAPERVRGGEGGPESDLWSLAMMLYVAVEGRHPLRRATTLATLAAVLDEELPPPRRAGALAPLLAAVLVKDPARRPDVAAADAMLAEAAAGATPHAAPFTGTGAGGARPHGARSTGVTSFHLAPPVVPSSAPSAPSVPSVPSASSAGPPADAASPAGPLAYGGPHPAPPAVHPLRPPFPHAHSVQDAGPARKEGERARVRRVAAVGASAAATVVAGALAVTFLLPGDDDAEDRAVKTPVSDAAGSRTHTPTHAVDIPAGSGDSESSGPDAARTDLLTPDGIRTAVAAIKAETGTDRVCSLVVYPEHVSANVMVDGSRTRYDSWTYRSGTGAQKGIISGSVSAFDSPFRVDDFDWDALPGLLERGEKELNVKDATSRYLVVSGADPTSGDPMGMSVYLTDDYGGTGFLEADHRGEVTRVVPNEQED